MSNNLANPNIKHVFVLMLENRAFDHMLGLSGISGIDAHTGQPTSIEGVNPNFQNTYKGASYPVTTGADLVMPFDPGHEFPDVVQQLCGEGSVYNGGVYPAINNSGFVADYAGVILKANPAATGFGEIMKCYKPSQLAVLTQLAQEFCVCDHWHASLPGPTWPNRFFAHATTSGGLDHSPSLSEIGDWTLLNGFSFPGGTIYDKLTAHGKTWRLYRGKKLPRIGSIPNVAALKGIKLSSTNYYEKFATDVAGEYSWNYTFIEPNYGDVVNNSYSGGQSEHPMDNVLNGEALVQSTYEAIRNSPLWESSLLIITYDEHGGFYDHVAPPAAVPPGDSTPKTGHNQYGFLFDRYGVRVPAVVISAYTLKNSISHTVFDHSSIPATLECMFGLNPMTGRDGTANNLTALAGLAAARTDTPEKLQGVGGLGGGIGGWLQRAWQWIRRGRGLPGPSVDETTETADKGNLPGFLHVVMKARAERQLPETHHALTQEFSEKIRTKADARNYLNTHLPEL
ncbi:MAG TPA: alkaline phosphatase family protein [Puia sp.]|nr:alkaline phosphatase family protein [Puia sp.]